jgi:hypothetical protein
MFVEDVRLVISTEFEVLMKGLITGQVLQYYISFKPLSNTLTKSVKIYPNFPKKLQQLHRHSNPFYATSKNRGENNK